MGNKSASILVVPVMNLQKMPKAFQEYVEDYFVAETIFGIHCMVAFRTTSRPEKKSGVAPSHSSDLACYKTGLGKKDLGDWIKRAAEEGKLWLSWKTWDDGCISCVVDD